MMPKRLKKPLLVGYILLLEGLGIVLVVYEVISSFFHA
jgi:hypothetical protein